MFYGKAKAAVGYFEGDKILLYYIHTYCTYIHIHSIDVCYFIRLVIT